MPRRLQALLVTLLALPGLLGRQAAVVVHEHDGGSDVHHHAALVGYIDHSHPHDDDAPEEAPAGESETSGEDGLPGDGERHGHCRGTFTAAVRRTTLADDAGAGLAEAAFHRSLLPYGQRIIEAAAGRPSRTDWRGCAQLRTGRMIDRLVQGIGLLI